jgi:hypothetical protein
VAGASGATGITGEVKKNAGTRECIALPFARKKSGLAETAAFAGDETTKTFFFCKTMSMLETLRVAGVTRHRHKHANV